MGKAQVIEGHAPHEPKQTAVTAIPGGQLVGVVYPLKQTETVATERLTLTDTGR